MCVDAFEEDLLHDPAFIERVRKELPGLVLAYPGKCCPKGPCHARTLVRVANGTPVLAGGGRTPAGGSGRKGGTQRPTEAGVTSATDEEER